MNLLRGRIAALLTRSILAYPPDRSRRSHRSRLPLHPLATISSQVHRPRAGSPQRRPRPPWGEANTRPKAAGQPQAGPAKRDAALPHKESNGGMSLHSPTTSAPGGGAKRNCDASSARLRSKSAKRSVVRLPKLSLSVRMLAAPCGTASPDGARRLSQHCVSALLQPLPVAGVPGNIAC